MSVEQATGEVSPWVQLFQKAHQKIVLLDRLDEQILQILTRREELQGELRDLQGQINKEFDQRIQEAGEPPARLLEAIGEDSHRRDSAGRFTSQPLESVLREQSA